VNHIFDARLLSTDTQLRNRSGDGISVNATNFAVGVTCPASALMVASTPDDANINGGSFSYLINAAEIPGTGGNNNGYCEAGETCVYQPNIGSFLGEGGYTSGTCVFPNSFILPGVKLYQYNTTSVPID